MVGGVLTSAAADHVTSTSADRLTFSDHVTSADHPISPLGRGKVVSFADGVALTSGLDKKYLPSNSLPKPNQETRHSNIRKLAVASDSNTHSTAQSLEPDYSHSSDDSDASWIAEACSEAPDLMEPVTENVANGSDESWIAEEVDPLPLPPEKPEVNSRPTLRPLSIVLAQKELSQLTEEASPNSYTVGEGTAGVAQESASLLTPGAEVTVQRVTNPAYASRPPQIFSPGDNSSRPGGNSSTLAGSNKPLVVSAVQNQGHKLSTTLRWLQQEAVSWDRKICACV